MLKKGHNIDSKYFSVLMKLSMCVISPEPISTVHCLIFYLSNISNVSTKVSDTKR